MVIWSEFRIGQYGDDDHQEDAPHFSKTVWIEDKGIHGQNFGRGGPGLLRIFCITALMPLSLIYNGIFNMETDMKSVY